MWNARSGLAAALISLVIVGLFYLLREHWGHGLGILPYLLLLACPLLHLFMHGHPSGEEKSNRNQKHVSHNQSD
jgi:hypothetical protein